MKKKQNCILPALASLMTFTSFGLSVPVFAEEKEVPVNITVEATSINVSLPTSIELANAGNTVDVTVASTNKIVNNANTGAIYVQDIGLETLNNWSLGDKTAKYEEMAKDSKNLYLGIKLSDETDFANLKESYEPTNKKIEAKSEKGLLFEGKTNITSSKLTNQVGNLVITVGESEKVIQNGNLRNGFLYNKVIPLATITEMSFMTTQDTINPSKSWDASVEGDGSVMAWVDQTNPTKVLVGAKNGKVIAPQDSYMLLYGLQSIEYIDVTNLNVSNIITMEKMFLEAGYKSSSIQIKGLDTWNTSKVNKMNGMFMMVGPNATTFNIGDLSKWDVSNVTNIDNMFNGTAEYKATNFNIGNLENWNISNVTSMTDTFYNTAKKSSFTPPSWYK